MKRNNFIENSPEDIKSVVDGSIDLFYDKSDLNQINVNPNNWNLYPDIKNALVNIEDNKNMIIASPKFKVGNTYQYSEKIWIEIIDARLLRLEEMNESDALRTGITKTEKGYKHYCPKKLFPAKILSKQEPGFPYMQDARTSFFTKWIDKHGLLDVSINPWIWRYEFKININRTFPN